MIIPVLPELNSRAQWIAFCRRETPYCFVATPECLVDMQTSYLQLTLLSDIPDGKQPVKYSLGSRLSVEPVWQLIKGCQWNLATIIEGLEALDFRSNVRDNSLLGVHTDLTVRKFFAKERPLIAPSSIGLLQPLHEAPPIWSARPLMALLANGQYQDLQGRAGSPAPPVAQLLLQMMEQPQSWLGHEHRGRLYLLHERKAVASLLMELKPPKPRLAPDSFVDNVAEWIN
ncbi:hypothetical protein [Marinobacterium arenosum]|uniref:hypothetical protein n=1 Tax=Marinobacterium arenosum TaxID=2862496 RepID=UPI001C988B7C|nr:hypothetical protein [Marinobacterium arenosum]MBY4678739.1 hypothetical protein [Marinobacterium arenosum]